MHRQKAFYNLPTTAFSQRWEIIIAKIQGLKTEVTSYKPSLNSEQKLIPVDMGVSARSALGGQ